MSLHFNEMYDVLKYLKMYIKKQKSNNIERSESEKSEIGGIKDLMSSFDSKHPNNTVE